MLWTCPLLAASWVMSFANADLNPISIGINACKCNQLTPFSVHFPAVPRLLNRIYDAIYAKVRGNLIKKTLLRWAYHSKRADLERHVIRRDTIWDWLVFGQIRANLGGRVRLICVGSAPLSHEVLDFLRCALGSVVSRWTERKWDEIKKETKNKWLLNQGHNYIWYRSDKQWEKVSK